MKIFKGAIVALIATAATTASGEQLTITIENPQAPGGLAFTPVWLGLHDNTFQSFVVGQSAGGFDGITQIAELGDTSAITTRFGNEQPNGEQTTALSGAGAPPFEPGESASVNIDVNDPTTARYLNFAAMVLPSNDLFIGNENGIEIFDAGGNFAGPITIEIFGADIWDNGSEVNDVNDGPAFVMGQDAMAGTDENGVVRAFFTQPGDQAYIDSLVGLTTATGDVVTTGITDATLFARITIVPSPGAFGVMALASGCLIRRRR